MSPTAERKQEIAFSSSYYTSEPVLLVKRSAYANAKFLETWAEQKSRLNKVFILWPDFKFQVPKETAMGDFTQMRQAWGRCYWMLMFLNDLVPMTAEFANAKFKMIQPSTRFQKWRRRYSYLAIGLRKMTARRRPNQCEHRTISKDEQVASWIVWSKEQLRVHNGGRKYFFSQVTKILSGNWQQSLRVVLESHS